MSSVSAKQHDLTAWVKPLVENDFHTSPFIPAEIPSLQAPWMRSIA